VTREDGTFIITPIRTGSLHVRVEFPGFRKTERRGIGVSIQQSAVVDFTLETGNLTEDVVVTAQAPLLETGTGTVGQTLGSGHDREPADQRARTTRSSRGSAPASCRRSPAPAPR
jgi:hypothetical protein